MDKNLSGKKRTNHKKGIARDEQERKRKEAEERNAAWAKLTPAQQIAALDKRLGVGVGATEQRLRILNPSKEVFTIKSVDPVNTELTKRGKQIAKAMDDRLARKQKQRKKEAHDQRANVDRNEQMVEDQKARAKGERTRS